MRLNNELIVACARLCRASYAIPGDDDQAWAERTQRKLPAYGFEFVRCRVSDDSEVIAATWDDCRIYAWRGSSSIIDWIADFSMRKIPWYQSGRVHSGFNRQFRSIWEQGGPESLENDVKTSRRLGQRIICTGHSLGAAAATVQAAFELEQSRGVHGLVTFGSPRVGDANFAAAVKAGIRLSGGDIVRVVNLCDVVTAIPSLWKSRHVDLPFYFARDGSLKIRPSFYWQTLDRTILSLGRYVLGELGAIGDHNMEVYFEKVKQKFRSE